jgi:hypothetical protein
MVGLRSSATAPIIAASRHVSGPSNGDHQPMIRMTRAGLGATLILPFALIVAACGGGAAVPSSAASAAASAAESIAASVEPGLSIDPNISLDPNLAIPSFDIGALTGALPGVDSYRVSWSTDGKVTYESVVVTKPVVSKAITTYNDDGTVDTRFIIIGDKLWSASGADGTFEEVPANMATAMLTMLDPTMLFGAWANVPWGDAATSVGTEDKNGIQTHHVRIDPTTITGLGAQMPAGSSIDVWVADAGYLVAWEMTGFEDGDMSIQVSGVNDPANKVEAP